VCSQLGQGQQSNMGRNLHTEPHSICSSPVYWKSAPIPVSSELVIADRKNQCLQTSPLPEAFICTIKKDACKPLPGASLEPLPEPVLSQLAAISDKPASRKVSIRLIRQGAVVVRIPSSLAAERASSDLLGPILNIAA